MMADKRPGGMYKLRRPFYDGETLHPRGAVLFIKEGQVPSTAQPMKKKEPAPEFVEDAGDENPQTSFALDPAEVEPGDTLKSLSDKATKK